MKRYLVFAGFIEYRGAGGWEDFKKDFETLKEAVEFAITIADEDWWHISDLETSVIVVNSSEYRSKNK